MGTNKVIAEGDIVTISPDISINIKDANIVWSSNPEGTSCNDCPQLTVEPTITTVYNVVVTNENGCRRGLYRDQSEECDPGIYTDGYQSEQ
ncbi:MAG: hypothetical protein IPO45_17365 [Saprospiraceae bacterium]|nr:hypothetical protein [Candidatus Brachybacter algidus]